VTEAQLALTEENAKDASDKSRESKKRSLKNLTGQTKTIRENSNPDATATLRGLHSQSLPCYWITG
jgi:hypothetical protein